MREAVAARGVQIILMPPCSPGLNHVENFFAKFKALLRKAAERHFDTLVDRIKLLLGNVTTEECANYFIAAGYVKIWIENALKYSVTAALCATNQSV